MSWGVDIVVDHGDGYKTRIEVVDGHTYNLTPMWRKASVVAESTSELHGRSCREMQPVLINALKAAWSDPSSFRELDPPNGWGDFDGFLTILTRLARLCHEHPRGVLDWNG